MTWPAAVYFGPDGSQADGKNKIHLRTLLYSTAKRGQVIESLHIVLEHHESKRNFTIWVYGDRDDLKRGSGLFVPQEGVAFEHHFLQPEDGANFAFTAGDYRLTVYAKLTTDRTPHELMVVDLSLSDANAETLSRPNTGVYFNWGPNSQRYHPHIKVRSPGDPLKQLLEVFTNDTKDAQTKVK